MDRKLSLIIQFAAADRLSGSLRKIVGLGDSGAQSLAKMKREARELSREMAGATGNVTALIERERALERAMERQKRRIAIDNRVGRMQAQAANYRSAGQDNMVQGAAMAAPLVIMGKGAMDFSSGMVDLQQKAELSNRELVVMRGNILAAAKATHQLPEDMRAAVDVLAGFGMDARQAVTLAEPIGRLGTAFKVELADASAAAFANVNNLKVPLTEVRRSFDIMAEGGKMGAFEIKDMARQFPALTAQMQALGQTGTPAVADLTAALQVAMNTAGSADEAGNNIANLLGKINSPTVINAFAKKFGVDLPAAMKKARAEGKTTMEAFAEIAKKATGGDTTKLGWVVEDRQAQMGLLALMQNMDKYRDTRARIGKADGTVQAAFNQRELNDARVGWSKLMSQLQTTGLILGTKLLPAANQFMGVVGGVAGAVGNWAEAHPRLASGIMTLIAGMAVARIGIGALQFAFGGVLGPLATAWGWFQKFRTLGAVAAAFGRLGQGFAIVRTAALFMAQGVMRAGLMMLANPVVLAITAIVLAIGAAGYLIYRNWDTIKAAFATGIGYLGQAWNWIKGKFLQFPVLFGPLGMAAGFIINNWGAIRGAFATGAAMLGTAWQWIKAKFDQGMAFFKALPGQMLSIGVAIMQGIVRGIMAAPGAVWNALKSIVLSGITNLRAFLGIKSPSRLFMGIGGYMTEGLAIGLDRGAAQPLRSVDRLAVGVAGAMALASPTALAARPAAAQDAGLAGSRAAASQRSGDTINITIQQLPGENAEALANRVMELLDRRQRSRSLGAYRDV